MHSESIISTQSLSRSFQSAGNWFNRSGRLTTVAVQNVSIEIREGERVAFIGPNGAGKSTTIRMLSGLLYPTSGSAQVCGLVPWEQRKKLSYQIGCVFGHRSALWQGVSVSQSFELLKQIYDIRQSDFERRIATYISALNLAPYMGKDPRSLSLGERMRCDIAAALLHGPRLLFLDEPSLGLDIEARLALREVIRSICSQYNVTVLLTSHDTGDIEGVCDRVIVINHGSLVIDAPISKLRGQFMREKILTIHTSSTPKTAELAGATVRALSSNQISIELDTSVTSVEIAISALLAANNEVSDVQISERPFEEVIRELYRLGGAR